MAIKIPECVKSYLKRILDIPKYVWVVTQEGSDDGYYDNNASSSIFLKKDKAIEFVKQCARECVMNRGEALLSTSPSDEVIDIMVNNYVKWFGELEAQYIDGPCIADWKIERLPMPTE